MKTASAFFVALLVVTSSLVMARKSPPPKPFTQLALVPEDARAQTSPLTGDATAAMAGHKLYDRHCATCHGASGENGRKGPGLKAPEVQTASDGALFWVLSNGNVRAGMPVWTKLPEPQRWQLVSYLKSLGVAAGRDDVRP
jgi:mono/diheme cytochrome c family protein